MIANYSDNMDLRAKHTAKGFVGLRRVFVELLKEKEVSNLSKYTVLVSDELNHTISKSVTLQPELDAGSDL